MNPSLLLVLGTRVRKRELTLVWVVVANCAKMENEIGLFLFSEVVSQVTHLSFLNERVFCLAGFAKTKVLLRSVKTAKCRHTHTHTITAHEVYIFYKSRLKMHSTVYNTVLYIISSCLTVKMLYNESTGPMVNTHLIL